jgi:hypothetical protein
MAEAAEAPIKTPSKETARNYPHITFQPSQHLPRFSKEMEEMTGRYLQGDPHANVWSSSHLLPRLRGQQPKMLSIDSAFIPVKTSPSRTWVGESDPYVLWTTLPGMPSEINDEGKILVVSGDMEYAGAMLSSLGEEVRELDQALKNKGISEEESVLNDYYARNGLILLGVAGLVDASILTAAFIHRRNAKRNTKKSVMPRRRFLQIFGGISAGVATAPIANLVGQAVGLQAAPGASTEAAKDFWLKVVDMTSPVIDSDWIQMRNAMQILKLKDSIDNQGLPSDVSASVIAGSAHSYGATALLASEDACNKAIASYMQSFSPLLDEAIKNKPSIKREEAIAKIKEYLVTTVVSEVKDPDHRTIGTTQFPNAVSSAIKTVAQFRSPRMEAALADFH